MDNHQHKTRTSLKQLQVQPSALLKIGIGSRMFGGRGEWGGGGGEREFIVDRL